MAATKIYPIKATEAKALAYIANPEKTENGKYILTSNCSRDPYQASRDFDEIRAMGTGLNTVLSQHIIQSFAPGEVTPEQAMMIGEELCHRLLGEQYQFVIATHIDHDHIHNHIVFNNTNMISGYTFETEHNQGKKSERA